MARGDILLRVRGASISIALAALCAAGCNQILGIGNVKAGSSAPPDTPITNPDAPMASDCPPPPADGIIGCANVTQFNLAHPTLDGANPVVRADMSKFNVAAYVPDSSMASGFKIINGTASADGTVIVHGVDPGVSYYLRLQNPTDPLFASPHYFYTSQRQLDLGYNEVGRDDTPTTSGTSVTFDLSGMTAWGLNDDLYVQSYNTGTGNTVPPPLPAAGATAGNLVLDWNTGGGEVTWEDVTDEAARPPQLLDSSAARNDDLWVLHDRTKKTDVGATSLPPVTGEYISTTLLDGVSVDPGMMKNGTPQTITATLATAKAVTTPQHWMINYDALRGAFKDNGVYIAEQLSCGRVANPGADVGLQEGQLINDNAATIYGWEHSADFTHAYADPYPSTWPQVISCAFLHQASYKTPNGNRAGTSYITAIVPAVDTFTMTPPLHGATNWVIGGQPALTSGTVPFDGVTPVTMSWDAQAGVSHYQIRIIGAVEGVVAGFDTSETSIVIPADTFTKGNFYIFRVFAIQTPTDYAGGHLLRYSAPFWYVRLASALFRFSKDCGNGKVDSGEDCDPGTPGVSTPTCDADCTAVQCGDGFVNTAAGEQCDQRGDTPTCDADCKTPKCGDGYVNPALEQCDDGNTTNGDGCSSKCMLERCGDGKVDPGEVCDDGNRVSGDGCSSLCQPECGDGFVDTNEQCDDSYLNGQPGDHCSVTCTKI